MKIVDGLFAGSACEVRSKGLYIESQDAIIEKLDISSIVDLNAATGTAKKLAAWTATRLIGGILLGPVGYIAGSFGGDAYQPASCYRMQLVDGRHLVVQTRHGDKLFTLTASNPAD